ncbi:MAG: hypothetical protein KJ626_03260 [Verrucomicrobia bacterium]|nr:hypothetical protein [Verrucomicrobiota bacterium]
MEQQMFFPRPDYPLALVKIYARDEVLNFLAGAAELLVSGGRSLTWNTSRPDEGPYRLAAHRLKKAGLIVEKSGSTGYTSLSLTEEGQGRIPEFMRPEKSWRRRWSGLWQILSYDIPEENRAYRDVLRKFLARKKMGLLQKSLWITPDDVRAEYHNLVKAAGIDEYAYLFEVRTVLGQQPYEIVHSAWDFVTITRNQLWYCDACRRSIDRLENGEVEREQLQELAREELTAYMTAMRDDPLLPRSLWPNGYMGEKAFHLRAQLHEIMIKY